MEERTRSQPFSSNFTLVANTCQASRLPFFPSSVRCACFCFTLPLLLHRHLFGSIRREPVNPFVCVCVCVRACVCVCPFPASRLPPTARKKMNLEPSPFSVFKGDASVGEITESDKLLYPFVESDYNRALNLFPRQTSHVL